jgi:hypothetical protein
VDRLDRWPLRRRGRQRRDALDRRVGIAGAAGDHGHRCRCALGRAHTLGRDGAIAIAIASRADDRAPRRRGPLAAGCQRAARSLGHAVQRRSAGDPRPARAAGEVAIAVDADGRLRVRVDVPDTQPAGAYVGAVVGSGGDAVGTLAVRLAE